MSFFGPDVRNGVPIGLGSIVSFGRRRAVFSPASLFSSGEQGVFYDISDTATLFQDSAGTTPVTAVEQPVGLILDKSGRGNHASQTSTSPDKRPVWSARYNLYLATDTLSTQNVTTVATSYRLRFTGAGTITLSGTATGTYSAGTHTITCTAGTLTSTVSGTVTDADLRVANESSALPPYQRVVTATDYDTTGFPAFLRFDGTNDALVTNSIDFSTGATNPPLGPELVTNGNFDTASDWTLGAGWSIGGGVASRVSDPNVTAITQNDIVPVAGWYRISLDVLSISGRLQVRDSTGSTNFIDTFTTGTKVAIAFLQPGLITIFVRQTSSATIDNVSVKEFDANYLPDRMSVFAGVRKLSDAEVVTIELSASVGVNAGAFSVASGTSTGVDGVRTGWHSGARGSAALVGAQIAQAYTFTAPDTAVLSSTHDISGDLSTIRRNALAGVSATGDKGTGNFGNYPLYIGARGTTQTVPFNGRLHSLIVLGRTVTATELTQTEGYVESKTFGKDMNYVLYEPVLGSDGDQITLTAGGDDLFVYQNYE